MSDDASAVVSVVEAVTAELAVATFSQPFKPVRSYADWLQPLETDDTCKENTLYVDVVPVATAQEIEPSSRATIAYSVPIDIAVRKKFGANRQDSDTGRIVLEDVDRLMRLVQEIHEYFTLSRMESFEAASWTGTKTLVAPYKQHLRDMHQFTGIVRVSFRVDRKVD